MKKVILGIALCFVVVGCTNKELKDAYDNMQIGKDLKGYAIDLRIYGKVNNKRVNEIVKIYNYENKDYKISVKTANDYLKEELSETDGFSADKEKVTYILDGKVYVENAEGKYVITNEDVAYSNPSIFFEGIENANKDSVREEKIGDHTYKVYAFDVNKTIAEDIVKEIGIDNLKVENEAQAEAYIDDDGYVYRIIYTIGELVVNINYFSINTVLPITVPSQNDLSVE